MARKPKDEPEDEEAEEGLRDDEAEMDEAGFHVADDEDEDPAAVVDDEKGLDSDEDVEYVRGPKKTRRRPGTKLLDDYEDHLVEEDEEEKEDEDDEDDSEEEDLDEEDWDDEDEEDEDE